MAEERTRRLPKWLAINNDEPKKKVPEENKLRQDREELPTPPRNSVSLAKKETKRKRGNILKDGESSKTSANISRGKKRGNLFKDSECYSVSSGKKRKQNAKSVASPPADDHRVEEDEDDLTVDDLVSIAQEYIKGSEDSEQWLLLSGNGQPSSSNAIDELSEQKFSSRGTQVSSGSTVDLASEQSFVRTDDPALDMLHLFLGPLP